MIDTKNLLQTPEKLPITERGSLEKVLLEDLKQTETRLLANIDTFKEAYSGNRVAYGDRIKEAEKFIEN